MQKLLFIFFSILLIDCHAQNLVPNPGFDTYTICPNTASQSNLTPPWSNVAGVTGSPDYMNMCSTGQQSVPTNFYGYQVPVSGTGYFGLITYYAGVEVREYLTVPLSSALVSGTTYSVGFHVSLSDNFKYATDHFGAYLSNGPIVGPATYSALNFTPQIDNPAGNVISDMVNWTLVSGTYTAVGGESVITIGNFYHDVNTLHPIVNPSSGLNWAYYYVDDVFVIPVTNNLQITGPSSTCLGDSVTLHGISSSTFAWADSLNPTNILGTDSTLTIAPTVTTTYYLYGASDTASFTVHVINHPYVNLGNDTTICDYSQFTLNTYHPNQTYLWQDNSTNAAFTITSAGTYWVQVDSLGCKSTDTIHVFTTPSPVVHLGNDTSFCENNSLALNAFVSGATYQWQDNSTLPNFTVTQSGPYWVEVTKNACSTRDTIQVNVIPLPIINLGNDTSICVGKTLTLHAFTSGASYLWSNSTTNSFLNVNANGTYWVEVNVMGCKSSDTIVLNTVPLPLINLGNDTSFCEGNSIVLNASYPGSTYLWQDNSAASTFVVNQSGVYWAQVTSNNCSARDSIIVKVVPLPVINLGNNQSICEGDDILLDASTPNATYTWSDLSTNANLLVDKGGLYWVQVNVSNCVSTDSINVVVKPLPALELGPDIFICQGVSTILNAGVNANSYLWNTQATTQTIEVNHPGIFWVKKTLDGCEKMDSIEVNYTNEHCNCNVYVPNAFTPNDDYSNDEFRLLNMNSVFVNSFRIYDRWGNKVFEANHGEDYAWNGRYKGAPCDIGTYYFVASLTCLNNNKEFQLKGDITLLR